MKIKNNHLTSAPVATANCLQTALGGITTVNRPKPIFTATPCGVSVNLTGVQKKKKPNIFLYATQGYAILCARCSLGGCS